MNYTDLLKSVQLAPTKKQQTMPQGTANFITQDSRKVTLGTVYVCIKGRLFDGHSYAQQAVDAGAGMIITQRELGVKNEVVVENTRAAYAQLCKNYFGGPSDKMMLIGVTGTNGKTTVSTVAKQTLEELGHKCGLIGTIRNEISGIQIPAKFTTPEAWDLHALFAKMYASGCTHVIMETSSQALEQGRLMGVHFALGIFMNLTQDHLDYHGDMQNYFDAKKILFAQSDAMLTNIDDEWGAKLFAEKPCAVNKSYSAKNQNADYFAADIDFSAGAVDFNLKTVTSKSSVSFPMPGQHSVENALAAAGALNMLGYNLQEICNALAKCSGVEGRTEVLYNKDFTVIRDYAHTGDAVEKLLSALHPFVKNKLHFLYGCAGRRDPGKRVTMTNAGAKYADILIISSDNPSTENASDIAQDSVKILQPLGKEYYVQVDRYTAILDAMDRLQQGDMLVLCGKGHEDYQVMNGYTIHLDESFVVKEWLVNKGLA